MIHSHSTQAYPYFGRIRRIHFIGIGGVGMSGIAEVLLNLGYQVSGSDRAPTAATNRLLQLGATIYFNHAPENIANVDVVVISTAISNTNPELVAANVAQIPVIRRAEMLAELMRFRFGIAVAGTHGKTTTTSLAASVLTEGGLDPTYVIGGKLNSSGANARLGSGHYIVAEADESDASFLYLQPAVAIVTNIDADHMETYQGDFAKLRQTFIDFLHHLPFYGLAIICMDDPVVAGMIKEIARPTLTYGFHEQAQYQACDYHVQNTQSHFKVLRPPPYQALDITLNMPGQHNVQNALAVIALATELGVKDEFIQRALQQFSGVGRRLQQLGEIQLPQGGKALVIDDYGHHPRELEATWTAIRQAWPDRRLVVIFQPHRFSRTAALWGDFAAALGKADQLYLAEIYAAGEVPIEGINSKRLCETVVSQTSSSADYLSSIQGLAQDIVPQLQSGDILLMQGAGDISNHAHQLLATFGEQE